MLKAALIVHISADFRRETLSAVAAVDLQLCADIRVCYAVPVGVAVKKDRDLPVFGNRRYFKLFALGHLFKIVGVKAAAAVFFKKRIHSVKRAAHTAADYVNALALAFYNKALVAKRRHIIVSIASAVCIAHGDLFFFKVAVVLKFGNTGSRYAEKILFQLLHRKFQRLCGTGGVYYLIAAFKFFCNNHNDSLSFDY